MFIIFVSLFQISCKNVGTNCQKVKLRNYIEDFIMIGFVSVDSKPMCLECGAILTNDSMKKLKLEHHQKSVHPSSVGKDREYSENRKKRQPVKQSDCIQ